MERDYKVKDTSQDILDLQNKMFNSLRPEQRIRSCLACVNRKADSAIFTTKRFKQKERNKQLFLRFYADDFSEEEKKKILEHIERT